MDSNSSSKFAKVIDSNEAQKNIYKPPCTPLPDWEDLKVRKLLLCRNWCILLYLWLCSYMGSIFLLAPFIICVFSSPKVFRKIVDFLLLSWFMFSEFMIVRCLNVRIRQFGDKISDACQSSTCSNSNLINYIDCNSLLIMNHRTDLDWFFIWGLGYPIHQMKIIMKESLKNIPGAGWAMQCGSFIFLSRQIEKDKFRLLTNMQYISKVMNKCQLLIFPEGTDLHQASLKRSDQYAEKNNLPYLRYTLHPRTTGFIYIVKSLMSANNFGIYDVTVAYSNKIPSSGSILRGNLPTEAHFHIRHYRRDELPCGLAKLSPDELDKQLIDWLQSKWLEKEQFLKEYYEKPLVERQFPNEIPVQSLVFDTSLNGHGRLTTRGFVNCLFWFVFPAACIYNLYQYWFVGIYVVGVHIIYIVVAYKFGSMTEWISRYAGIESVATVDQNGLKKMN